jgi:hypothetical protein
MPSMTSFETGDVVSVEFPYSDFQGRKRRPGLVLSGDEEDLLLARITTRPARAAWRRLRPDFSRHVEVVAGLLALQTMFRRS